MVQDCCRVVASLSMDCLVMLYLGFKVLQGRHLAHLLWHWLHSLLLVIYRQFGNGLIFALPANSVSGWAVFSPVWWYIYMYHISQLCWIFWSQFVSFSQALVYPWCCILYGVHQMEAADLPPAPLTSVCCFFTTSDWRTVLIASSKVRFLWDVQCSF